MKIGAKYIGLLLLGALAACQKGEDSEPLAGSGELTFTASIVDMAQSKAVMGGDFGAYGIDIAGYYTEGKFAEAIDANPALVYPNVFDRDSRDGQIPVPHVVKNGENRYVLKTVKWPLNQTSYLSYFAWSQGAPTTVNSGIVGATKDATTTGYPWIDVVNVDDPVKQIDVAAARHVDELNNRIISAIDLDFKHILSKLTFVFKSSAGANVEFTNMELKYATDQVRSKGRYTFNTNPADSVGHFGELSGYHAGTFSLSKSPINQGAEVTQGEMLLIPQTVSKGFLTFDLTYTISSSEGKYTHTKTVDLPATKLVEGANHIFTIDIYGEQIIVHNAAVSDWIPDATPRLPFVPGPMGEVQLLLDGYDKPYQHIDGKWYWLDRSGYNRHVEITGDNLASVYNETEHSYNFDGTTLLKAPYSVGTVTSLSMDVVVQATEKTHNVLFTFSGNTSGQVSGRTFFSHYAYGSVSGNGAIFFDSGDVLHGDGNGRLQYNFVSDADTYLRRMVTYQRQDGGRQQLYVDAGVVGDIKSHSYIYGNVSIGNIGSLYKGKIFYIKLTNTMRTIPDIVKSYQSCRIKYSIPIDETYLPPVKDGLMFCFDGRHAPKTVSGKQYWIDEVGKNDAEIIGTVNYNATNKYYSMDKNTATNYMKMLYTVAMHNNFTAEFVLRQDAIQGGSPIYWGIGEDKVSARYLFMHIPFTSNYEGIHRFYVDSPGLDRYEFPWPYGGTNYYDERRKIVIRRYNGMSELYINNKKVGEGVAKTDMSTKVCTVMNFGGHGWGGEFNTVRYYDRALNDTEMKANYDFDKSNFNLIER